MAVTIFLLQSTVFPIYYRLSLIFVVLVVISTGNDTSAITKSFADIWEYGDTAKKTSDGARNSKNQTGFKDTPKLARRIRKVKQQQPVKRFTFFAPSRLFVAMSLSHYLLTY